MSTSIGKYKTLGATRSLSSKYVELKRNTSRDTKRVSLNDSGSGSLINDNGKINLISKNNHLVEMSNWHLPPKYIEIFDSTNDILKELLIKFARLQEDQQRRIMPKFDDDENRKIDKLIRDGIRDMTNKIRECEENIKQMSREKVSDNKEASVRDNMKLNLVNKLTDFTKKLKLNEEEYMRKYKELVGDDFLGNGIHGTHERNAGSNPNSNPNNNPNINPQSKENFLKFENSEDILRKRDSEINNLLNSISELASIFKDFQTLVLEQGTILDRIDYNIESALSNTKIAHENLEKANKNMESNCARNSNLTIIFVIFILSILLIFKYIK